MEYWEFALFFVLAGIGTIPLLRFGMRGAGEGFIGALLILVTSVFALVFWPQPPIHVEGSVVSKPQWFRNDQPTKKFVPPKVKSDGYVSAETCRSCHPKHHASWHDTYHRSMTQIATPAAIANPAAFDGQPIQFGNRTYRLQRKGDQFWFHGVDMDWKYRMVLQNKQPAQVANPPIVDRRIVMTTGSHHFQAYWVAAEGRGFELLQLPLVYGIETKQWLPSEDVFIRPPHAGPRVVMWNRGCIQCHVVHGQPRLSGLDSVFNSSVSDFGISCEACHGPGDKHVAFHRNPLNRYRSLFKSSDNADPTIVNPAKLSPERAGYVCGQCHATFVAKNKDFASTGVNYKAGDELSKTHKLFTFNDPVATKLNPQLAKAPYWGDGTMRAAGRDYMALIDSACYKRGHGKTKMHCLSCHSMHNRSIDDQLIAGMRGNRACTQCHQDAQYTTNIQQHTHHKAGSSGSTCYNCHMPYISYGLLKGIRSHKINVPSVRDSQKFGKPNGCNQCHTDKTLKWTAANLKSWYGIESGKLSDEHQQTSAMLLWALKGDAAQRAIAAWTLGWKEARSTGGDDWSVPILAQLLVDPYAAVRYVAYQSLKKQAGFASLQYNFVGDPDERERVRQRVMEKWKSRQQPLLVNQPSAARSILLLDKGRRIATQRWLELLKQRDDTELEFPE